MREEIISVKNEAVAQIMEARSASELEELRISYLGRSGKLTSLIKRLKEIPSDERKEVGVLINDSKGAIESLLAEQKNKLGEVAREWFDPTIPGVKPKMGHLHLLTQAIREISSVFEKIGFVRERYPEVEWDYYAFGALNFPKNHPARDDWETFFVDLPENPKLGPMLLTPHTSSGQIREMERTKPPIRMINIAKCYRRQSDVSHTQMFHQFEGLVVDKGINIQHLKGTLDYFAQEFYGPGTKSRIRPFHFQFTEPSFEVDFSCHICHGTGQIGQRRCAFCKSGWHEVGGAGMVHPNVLKAGGIDSNQYTGFAFGWGVERTYTLREGLNIDDIRLLYSGDVRFLEQF